ncbi:MAG: shikimate dehydrogenase [Pseudomonadota bacterium]
MKLAVLGYPISHSLSPTIHNYWIDKCGIKDVIYEAVEVKPEDLGSFIKNMAAEGYIGVNLTIPHKEAAVKFVDEMGKDSIADIFGAINTIKVEAGSKLVGYNTDSQGFIENLEKSGKYKNTGKALVLGAGGAARAVCFVFLQDGYEITISNRTIAKAQEIKDVFTYYGSGIEHKLEVLDWEQKEAVMSDISLLVNTTSLGMKGQGELDISLDNLAKDALVTDIVYNPLITKLLEQAQARGNPIVDGLGMLLYQAQRAFELWFPGSNPVVTEELRNLVLAKLKS